MDKKKYFARFKKKSIDDIALRKKLLSRNGVVSEEDFIKKAKAIEGDLNKVLSKGENISVYSPFVRVNKEKREVTGIATNEAVDSYGDIVRYDAVKEAMPEYMKFGNIREMHESKAAGTVKDFSLNDDDKELEITVKVVDDMAWTKVVEGVYKGFSIGGEILESVARMIMGKDADGNEMEMPSGGMDILSIKLIEISLVDRPANPEALISSYKMASDNKFTPARVLMPCDDVLKRCSSELTGGKIIDSIKSSHQLHKHNEDNNKNILIKENMSEKTLFEKSWGNVLEFFKKSSIDLDSFENDDSEITLKRSELKSIVKDSVEASIQKAEDVTKNDTVIEKSEDKPKDKEKDKPKDKKEEKSENKKEVSASPAKDIKETSNDFTPMIKSFEKMTALLEKQIISNDEVLKEVKSLKKVSGVSAQSADIQLTKTEDEASFKGML